MVASSARYAVSMAVTPIISSQTRVAAIAHDAAVPLVVDELAEVRVGLSELGTAVGVGVDVVQVGVVLQVALTRLVAGRAVERVVDQIHLQDELARLQTAGEVGEDFHAFRQWRRAGLDQTAAFAEDFDGANAARAPGAHEGLVAEIGDFDAGHARRFEDRRARSGR